MLVYFCRLAENLIATIMALNNSSTTKVKDDLILL